MYTHQWIFITLFTNFYAPPRTGNPLCTLMITKLNYVNDKYYTLDWTQNTTNETWLEHVIRYSPYLSYFLGSLISLSVQFHSSGLILSYQVLSNFPVRAFSVKVPSLKIPPASVSFAQCTTTPLLDTSQSHFLLSISHTSLLSNFLSSHSI